jgi:hypothetical protein
MPYVTLDDVRDALPQVDITAISKPNEGQVDDFIVQVEGRVDAVLAGLNYLTPITSDVAVQQVREIVLIGVIAKVIVSCSSSAIAPIR